jgi:preprotein translocase subunit SecY
MNWKLLTSFLPEIVKPKIKNVPFKTKIKWTLVTIILYFVLLQVPLFGLGQNALEQFFSLSIILGASFGSLISLGIGPIVTSSIVLQLLVGSGILKIDINTPEGKSQFQAMQKIATIAFIVLEAFIYVFMGGLAPSPELIGTSSYLWLQLALVGQLIIGGYLIVLMDEVIQKWGFGLGDVYIFFQKEPS